MVTGDDPFLRVSRVSRERFSEIVNQEAAPAVVGERDAAEYYDAVMRYKVDPLLLLAMFKHESQMGRLGTATQTKSWGNCRLPSFGVDPVMADGKPVTVAGRSGRFPVYATWHDGAVSTVARLASDTWPPSAPYGQRTTIRGIFDHPSGQTWAPASDLNNPHGYLASVLAFMNAHDEGGTMEHYGLTGLLDRRNDLPRNRMGGPSHQRPVATKSGIVIHYNGPAVPLTTEDYALLRADAYYHIQKDWDLGQLGVQNGDGLMYHMGIGRDGAAYLCRDFADVLWHCGTIKNSTALAIIVIMGGNQRATQAQLATLTRLCDEAVAAGLTTVAQVTGHQEESATSCPGTLMTDFVFAYRNGEIGGGPVADGHYFAETNHYVGGGFWDFWVENGGLMIFGLPVSDELSEDGMTVQYFERSRFEHHPNEGAGYQVQLTRLGVDAAKDAGLSGPGID